MKENVRRETEEDIRVNVSSAKDKAEADELTRKLKRAFVSGFSIGYNSSVNDIDNVDELFDKWMSIIDKNRISYTQKIKTLIDAICEKHGLPQPITVPAAGRMIAEYEGYFQAIELFEGAVRETDSIFKSSAYKATLETILKRNND